MLRLQSKWLMSPPNSLPECEVPTGYQIVCLSGQSSATSDAPADDLGPCQHDARPSPAKRAGRSMGAGPPVGCGFLWRVRWRIITTAPLGKGRVNLAQRGIACSLSRERRGGFEDGNVCRFNARFRRDCPDQYGQSGDDISARQIHGPRL